MLFEVIRQFLWAESTFANDGEYEVRGLKELLVDGFGVEDEAMRTCYDVLGCSSNASPAELKSAYFRSLRDNHPDKGGADTSAVTLITNAWKTLKEDSSRKSYDIWLREQQLRAKKGIIGDKVIVDEATQRIEQYCRGHSTMSSLKVVVLGSSGVGKSSFVNVVCNRVDVFPSSTVGCAVSVIAHQYRAGSAEEQTELIELWDIGGSTMHQKASAVFLEGAAGAILVHDLSNSKSETSLAQWVSLLRGDSTNTLTSVPSMSNLRPLLADIESTPIPTLVVGCKLDLAPERAKQAGYDRINVDCRKAMAPGSTNRIILSKFFDSVVERVKAPMASERRRRLL